MTQINRYFGAVMGLVVVVFLCLFSSADVSASTYSLSMTSSGAQILNATTTGDGVTIGADAIGVTTTCRYGYNFVINTSVNDNNLYLTGNASNNTAGTYFSPVDGTSTLNNSTNAWGYYYNSDSSVVPTKSSVFSPVPALGQTAVIKSASSTAASSDINDSFNLYYGVKTSSTMTSGTYKMIPDTNNSNQDGTIVYQATIADNCMRYTVEFNSTSTAGGTTLSGTGTMSSQNIYEDVATPLTSNGFTAPTGYAFDSWNTAQDGTGTSYDNGQSVTNLTTVGNTITLYAQWTDCPGGKICYKENGANVVGTMGQQTVSNSATSITLLASNFSRTGYGFAGWSDAEDYATNPNAHFYGPQETLTLTAGQYSAKGLKLYAVWIQSAGSLQSDTASVCATLTTAPTDGTANLSSVSALTDQRDNETYAIAKLADGNCWMIENLRLEAEGTRGNNRFNPSITNESLAQGYGTSATYGNFGGLADAENSGFSSTYTANSLYYSDTQEGTASINIGTTNGPGYRMPRYNNWNNQSASANRPQNPTTSSATNSTTNAGMYSFGNYYTWHATIADTSYYSTGNSNTTSICPTGWRVPLGNISTGNINQGAADTANKVPGFSYLDRKMGGSGRYQSTAAASLRWRVFPVNFLRAGYFSLSSTHPGGGYYWSSTSGATPEMPYILGLGTSSVDPGNTGGYEKFNGLSVRCVATAPQSVSTQANNIGYYANATDAKGTMGLQSITSSDTSATLLASNFSKDGYGFAGWSDVPDYYTNSNAHFYGPQETITFTAGQYSTDGLSLYAVWVKSEGSLQDSSKVTSVCNRLTTAPTNGTANLSSVSALTDQRNNQTYAIAKLVDGKCWMIENLRLDNTASHNSDGTLSRGYNSSFIGLAGPESPWANNSTTANSLYSTDGSTSATISGDNQGYRFPRYNNVNSPASVSSRPQSPIANNATNTTSNAGLYSYSNYYTWTAAVADTTDYTTGNQSISNTSICPSGWHLPKGGNKANEANNEFWALIVTGINGGVVPANYSSSTYPNYTGSSEGANVANALRAYPNNFIYSGYVYNSTVYNRGAVGRYWSSTVSSNVSAYNLYISDTNVNPGTSSNYKYFGWSIRCVAGN